MTTLAKINFDAYRAAVGGKTHDGRDMPQFNDVGGKVRFGWESAAHAVIAQITTHATELARQLKTSDPSQREMDLRLALITLAQVPDEETVRRASPQPENSTYVWELSAVGYGVNVDAEYRCGWAEQQSKLYGVIVSRCEQRLIRVRHEQDFLPRPSQSDGEFWAHPHHTVTLVSPSGKSAVGWHEDLGTAALIAYLRLWGFQWVVKHGYRLPDPLVTSGYEQEDED